MAKKLNLDLNQIAAVGQRLQDEENFESSNRYFELASILRPDVPLFYFRLGYGFYRMADYKSAIPLYNRALKLNPSFKYAKDQLRDCLGRIGDLSDELSMVDPSNIEVADRWHVADDVHFFPKKFDANSSFGHAVDLFVSSQLKDIPKLFDDQSQIITFGSCFAAELRAALQDRGHGASDIRIPEGLNNTFAILSFMEWCFTGQTSTGSYWYDTDEHLGISEWRGRQGHEVYRDALLRSDGFVFTLGLSEVWQDRETGGVFWRGVPKSIYDGNKHEVRLSTVDENARNIQSIYDLVQRHCGAKPVIFTLSPVPLNATFRGMPCVVADCASKAILRAALESIIIKKPANFYYWPSFEIVRWLGGHITDSVFGNDSSLDTRHVKRPVVGAIIDAFTRAFFVRTRGG